jgi:hypothetical protein
MRTLYHVTTRAAIRGISRDGYVRNDLSQGKRDVSYWVDENRLEWACVHVSSRRDVPCSNLYIVCAQHDELLLIRTAHTGVFVRDVPVAVSDIRPFSRMLPDEDGEEFPF